MTVGCARLLRRRRLRHDAVPSRWVPARHAPVEDFGADEFAAEREYQTVISQDDAPPGLRIRDLTPRAIDQDHIAEISSREMCSSVSFRTAPTAAMRPANPAPSTTIRFIHIPAFAARASTPCRAIPYPAGLRRRLRKNRRDRGLSRNRTRHR